MGATSEKVKNHIPDDLAICILSKFSLRSLKRFGCVHKSWALLLENPYFMRIFSNNFISKHHSYYDDTSLLLHYTKPPLKYNYRSSLYSLFGERFECRTKLDWPNPYHLDDPSFNILNPRSINGFFCLYTAVSAILWNPTTGEFKVLPPSPVESVMPYRDHYILVHGFGYDHVREDYKVIRHVSFFELTDLDAGNFDSEEWENVPWEDICYDPLWEIYSLKSNSWRKLEIDMPTGDSTFSGSQLYMDGMCHWYASETRNHGAYLVSFDLSSEVFFTTPIPLDIPLDMDDSFNVNLMRRHLFVLNGTLALISYYMDRTTFHISILGEIGEKESWTKLFTVGPFPCIEEFIGAWKNGVIFFRKQNDELVWFDLSTQMIEELGVKGVRLLSQIVMYKESLLPIGAIHD